MRFTPLVSSISKPGEWRAFPAAELLWEGGSAEDWLHQGPPIHAVHLPAPPSDPTDAGPALQALLALGADFLVLPAHPPADRLAASRLLGTLEILLEALGGRGPRLVLRPGAHSAELAVLLREVRGEAVGFCWDASVADIVDLEDRLLCAVAEPGDDLGPLQARGYRWNVAVPCSDAQGAAPVLAQLAARHPDPLFPTLLPSLPEAP